jgi:hypothetical protein
MSAAKSLLSGLDFLLSSSVAGPSSLVHEYGKRGAHVCGPPSSDYVTCVLGNARICDIASRRH